MPLSGAAWSPGPRGSLKRGAGSAGVVVGVVVPEPVSACVDGGGKNRSLSEMRKIL